MARGAPPGPRGPRARTFAAPGRFAPRASAQARGAAGAGGAAYDTPPAACDGSGRRGPSSLTAAGACPPAHWGDPRLC